MDNENTEGRAGGLLSRAFLALCFVYFLNSFLIAPFSALFPVYIESDLARLQGDSYAQWERAGGHVLERCFRTSPLTAQSREAPNACSQLNGVLYI